MREFLHTRIVDAASVVLDGVRGSGKTLRFGANSKRLTGSGEQIDSGDAPPPTNTGEELSFSPIMYPYRALLNADAQAIYNQVYANALAKNDARFTLVQAVGESVLSDIMNAVYNDHPELFWVDTAYSYGFIKSGSVVTVTLTYNDTIQNIEKAQYDFDKKVEAIVSAASAKSTDIEREKYVHDYLMQNVEYDVNAAMNQSAYSALVTGSSVCAGYSRAFQHILMRLDIPCYYVTGTAAGGDHAWNLVALGSDFYNVDASWDDAAGTVYGSLNYGYFNVPDAQFHTDHARSAMSALLPACNGTLMTYSAVYGAQTTAKPAAASDKLATYRELGFHSGDVLDSVADYNAYCRDALIRLGAGTHELTMVLKNATLMARISEQAESNGYIEGYAQEAVNELALQNARISLQLKYEKLADGYILLRQTVTLSGEQAAKATAKPTAVPTTASTAEPAPPADTPYIPIVETPPADAPTPEAPEMQETPQPAPDAFEDAPDGPRGHGETDESADADDADD